jgi:hypothetical protein
MIDGRGMKGEKEEEEEQAEEGGRTLQRTREWKANNPPLTSNADPKPAASGQSTEREEVSEKIHVKEQNHWLQGPATQQRKTKCNIHTSHGPCRVADPWVRCHWDSISFHCFLNTRPVCSLG